MSKRLAISVLAAALVSGCSGSSNSPPTAAPVPVAKADMAEADNGAAVLVDVLANDETGGGGALSIAEVGAPQNGTARISGARVEYTPNPGFFGQDQFSYRISNAAGQSSNSQVTVSSAMTVRLQGRVVLLRDEPVTLRSAGGAIAAEQALPAGEPTFSIRLRSETPQRALLLEATGGEAPGLPLRQRYVSLLPSVGELREQAACGASDCVVDGSTEPRLSLGALPTAEYGLLRELASAERLLEPGVRAELLGYVPADPLLQHAALIERGVKGLQAENPAYTADDSLALVLSREELARVAQPVGGPGSGGVANEYALQEARRSLAFDSPWSASAEAVETLRQQGSLTWLGAPSLNRRFAISQWQDGRLLSHGDTEQQTGDDVDNYVFRRLDQAVDASVEEGLLVLRPTEPGAFVTQRAACFADACRVDVARALAIAPFLGRYAIVIERGPVLGFGDEAPIREESVALLQPLPLPAESVPAAVYTALATEPAPTAPSRSRYFAEVLRLAPGGLFEMDDRARGPVSARSRQGQWRLGADGRTLELDDFSGLRERMWLTARGAERAIGVLLTLETDGSRRIAAVEWLPVEEAPAALPGMPQLCAPAADGWQPAARAPALAPQGERVRLGSGGEAVRFVGSAPPEAPSEYDRFSWRSVDGRIEFVPINPNLALPGFEWWGLKQSGNEWLVHAVNIDPTPSAPMRLVSRFQQFGGSLKLRCSGL